MIPSRSFLMALPRRPVDDRIVDFLRQGFPDIGLSGQLEEIALCHVGWPKGLDCGGFAFGHTALGSLARKPIGVVRGTVGDQLELTWLAAMSVNETQPLGAAHGPVIAVYAKDGVVQHFALGHLDVRGALPPTWFSKFGPTAVLKHGRIDLRDGDYGSIEAYVLCPLERCGTPAWAARDDDF